MRTDAIYTKTSLRPPDIELARWWAAATALGYIVLVITYWVVNFLRPSDLADYDFWAMPLVVSLIVGLGVVGIAQGFVLSRYIGNIPWPRWAVITILGYLPTIILATIYALAPQILLWLQGRYSGGDYARYDGICLSAILVLTLQGTLPAILQGRLLELRPGRLMPWLVSNIAAISASSLITALAIGVQLYPANMPLFSPLIAAVGGALAGAITGATLVKLLGSEVVVNSSKV